MVLQDILNKLMGVRYEIENNKDILCDNKECLTYGRKPICYMEWFRDCKIYEPPLEWRRRFIE